jgi:hypothetical protein
VFYFILLLSMRDLFLAVLFPSIIILITPFAVPKADSASGGAVVALMGR